jgi:hypothetical protein
MQRYLLQIQPAVMGCCENVTASHEIDTSIEKTSHRLVNCLIVLGSRSKQRRVAEVVLPACFRAKNKTSFSCSDVNFRLTNLLRTLMTASRHHDEGVSAVPEKPLL